MATQHIFFSYARRDAQSVDRIVEALRGAGYSVWIDRGGIPGAHLWRREIVVAIRDSNAFVIALSPHSVASDNVRKELDLSEQYRKHVVPLRLAETTIPDEMQYQLVGVQHVDCENFDKGFEELRRTLGSLNIEPLDPANPGPPAQPASLRGWEAGVFGATAALAAAIVYGMAWLLQRNAAIPSSLSPLMPLSLFDRGSTGLLSLGLLGILAVLGSMFGYFKSLRPAIVRLAPFFLLTIPLAIWKGQYIAASLIAIAAVAIGVWWSLGSRSGVARASSVALELILLGSVALGGTAQYLLARGPGSGSIIGVTPFEVADDEDLESKQVDLSNRLRLKLSAVFSPAGLKVLPQESFRKENLNDWSFDNWRVEKARQVEPRLLLRTTLSQCGLRALPNDPRPESYTWLAEPYGSDLEPFLDFARASGSDTRVLSFRIAYKLLTATPSSVGLSEKQRNAALREIVKDALTVARGNVGMAAQAETAISLLRQPAMDAKKVLELLNGFPGADGVCDEAATKNRKAQKAKALSYSEGGP